MGFAHTHVVQYFSAGRALDALMKDSPWSMEKSKEGSELRLEYREQAIDLMQELMRHKMFHRAKKIPVADRKKKKAEVVDLPKSHRRCCLFESFWPMYVYTYDRPKKEK